MSEQTPNYALNKPGLSDTADIAVINANMDILDTKLKEVENRAGGAPGADTVSDDAIGIRTPDSNLAPLAPGSGKLGQLLSWIANRLTSITGKSNWWDTPTASIEYLYNALSARAAASDLTAHQADEARYRRNMEIKRMMGGI